MDTGNGQIREAIGKKEWASKHRQTNHHFDIPEPMHEEGPSPSASPIFPKDLQGPATETTETDLLKD